MRVLRLPSLPMSAPFLILQTGTPIPSMRRRGGFPHWIRVAAGLEAGAVRVVDVEAGGKLPVVDGHAGVLITGSGAMVSHRLGWSEQAADWLRQAVDAGMPAFGICYGHQLLAHALGGTVDDNPRGREMGTVNVRLHAAAASDPLFAHLPAQFPAQATHVQTVLAPPPGATVLAETDQDGCAAFRFGQHVWGVQFHPEFSTRHIRGYIAARHEALRAEGRCPHQVQRQVRATPWARRLLRRFVRHAGGR